MGGGDDGAEDFMGERGAPALQYYWELDFSAHLVGCPQSAVLLRLSYCVAQRVFTITLRSQTRPIRCSAGMLSLFADGYYCSGERELFQLTGGRIRL